MTTGVLLSVRVRDVKAAVAFYVDTLGFEIRRPGDDNCSLVRGVANLMVEDGASQNFYSPAYNAAIRARIGGQSPNAMYMEATDLDALYARVVAADVEVIDPIAERPWGQTEFTVADIDGNWLSFWNVPAK